MAKPIDFDFNTRHFTLGELVLQQQGLVDAGFEVDTHEAIRMQKAFRLRYFGRCPECDGRLLYWRPPDDFMVHEILKCPACNRYRREITLETIQRVDGDPDKLALLLVDEVMIDAWWHRHAADP